MYGGGGGGVWRKRNTIAEFKRYLWNNSIIVLRKDLDYSDNTYKLYPVVKLDDIEIEFNSELLGENIGIKWQLALYIDEVY